MCMVSMIYDTAQKQWPLEDWERKSNQPSQWNLLLKRFNALQEAVDKLQEVDKLLDQPDCEDYLKKAYMDKIKQLIDQIKEKVNKL